MLYKPKTLLNWCLASRTSTNYYISLASLYFNFENLMKKHLKNFHAINSLDLDGSLSVCCPKFVDWAYSSGHSDWCESSKLGAHTHTLICGDQTVEFDTFPDSFPAQKLFS